MKKIRIHFIGDSKLPWNVIGTVLYIQDDVFHIGTRQKDLYIPVRNVLYIEQDVD